MDQIMKIIAWSFYYLSLGVHPEKDWDNYLKPDGVGWPLNSAEAAIAGMPLADGLRGVLYMLKGDLDHFAEKWVWQTTGKQHIATFVQQIEALTLR